MPLKTAGPWLCLFVGCLLAVTACFLVRIDFASRDALETVSGEVQSIEFTDKHVEMLHVHVRNGTQLYHLTQEDLSSAVPAVMTLRQGDEVVALVKHDSMGRDLEWLWELNRGKEQILAYSQTLEFKENEALGSRNRFLAWAALFFVCGIVWLGMKRALKPVL